MLRFNCFARQNLPAPASYFNTSYVAVQQHIVAESTRKYLNFNTSYVAVQLKYFNRTSIISFHFNTSYVAVQHTAAVNAFSTDSDFNTSYVAVQLMINLSFIFILIYFNTSYVAVQRCLELFSLLHYLISIHLMLRFNPLWLYILLFSSYQKSTEVTIFSIIFSNDKRCLGKNKKITWKDLKYQVFLFVLLFFNWKNFSICSL